MRTAATRTWRGNWRRHGTDGNIVEEHGEDTWATRVCITATQEQEEEDKEEEHPTKP
jgi:hypothetical protein